jgi:hypothetical protein
MTSLTVNPHLYILSDPCQFSDSTLVIYTVRSMSIVRLDISYIHCILSDPCQLSDWSLVIYTVRSMSIVRLVISYIYCQTPVNCQTGQYTIDMFLTVYIVNDQSDKMAWIWPYKYWPVWQLTGVWQYI